MGARKNLKSILIIITIILLSTLSNALPFFTMDTSSGAAPSAGWPGNVAESATHTKTFMQGAGPSGQNAYRFRQLHAPNALGYGGEFDWGWNGNIEAQDPLQGARRYYRFRMRWTPETNFRGLYWQDGSPINLMNKILIVGDGCGSRCRFILQYRGTGISNQAQYIRMQLDGGVDPAEIGPVNTGQWMNIQLELDSSTTTSSGDGGYKMWLNNDNYNSPSAQRLGIQLNPTRWRYVFLGAYNNNGLASDGVHEFLLTDFEADTEFDPDWNTGVITPPTDTTAPTRSNSQPTGTLAAGTTSTTISLSTNEAATCRYSTTTGVAYASMTNTFTTTGSTTHSRTITGLTNGQTYNYYVRCIDTANNANTNDHTITFNIANPDTTPPTQVTGLSATPTSSTQINLAWNAASDNIAVTGYRIYRNNVQIGTSTTTTYQDTGLTAATTYQYRINAYDSTGNQGTSSTTTSATTQTTTPPPTQNLIFDEGWESGTESQSFNSNGYGTASGSTQYNVQNQIRANGNYAMRHSLTTGLTGGVTDYITQHFGDAPTGPAIPGTAGNTYNDIYMQWKVYYSPGFDFRVNPKQMIIGTQDSRRHDNSCCNPWVSHYMLINSYGGFFQAEGNNKQAASGQWLNIALNQGGYSGSNRYQIQSGRWYTIEIRRRLNDANQDNGIFEMWIDGTQVARHTNVRWRVPWTGIFGDDFQHGTNFIMISDYLTDGIPVPSNQEIYYDDIKIGTTYIGSGASPPPPTDTTPPSQVTGLSATSISSSQINLAWAPASDNTAVTGYRIYRNNQQIATTTTTTFSDNGLSPTTTYQYKISAYDYSGNSGQNSTIVSATTQNTPTNQTQINCETSNTQFTNTAINTQTNQFTFEFDAIPNSQNLDALTGLSSIPVTTYNDMAITIRFANTNQIDARNGATYNSVNQFTYSAGVQYHFKIEGNLATRTYNVWVNAPGQQPTLIGNNYAFRTEQQNINSLNYRYIMSSAGTHTVCNYTTNTITPPTTIEGDVNNDRIVNIQDINAIVTHFGKISGYPNGINLAAPATIDLFDIMIIIRNWGRTN